MSENTEKIFDLIICGAGPSGITAAMYAGRANMSVLLIDKGLLGGVLHVTNRVDNYLGFPDGITGAELAMLFEKHVRRYVAAENILFETVEELSVDPDNACIKIIKTDNGIYKSHVVVIGSGSTPRPLPVEGSNSWRGRGLSYCAVCDGAFFNGKRVAVVGGGNAAIEEAIFLTRFASEVVVIHRRDELRAAPILQKQAFDNPKIKIQWDSVVVSLHGEPTLQEIEIENVKTKEHSRIQADGIFVYVGSTPNTEFVKIDEIKKDDGGYLIVDENMSTGVPGVYATGDVRAYPFRQIGISCGNGTIAALMAEKYIGELKREGKYRGGGK